MTELEAINQMLVVIGSDAVNSVQAAQPDVANARVTLDRVKQQSQRRGWWFNREFNVYYQPNDKKEIRIPSNVEAFEADDKAIIARGNKLYDLRNNTYQFESQVLAVQTRRNLSWEELPQVFQDYVTYLACTQFVASEELDQVLIKQLQEDAQRSYLEVLRQDLAVGKYNIMENQKISANRAGIRPYNPRRFR